MGFKDSIRQYIESEVIALEYDEYYLDDDLFRLDVEFLDRFIKEGRLLDVGCGTGRHLLHFAKRGIDVTGIDLSDHMLHKSKEKLGREGVSGTLLKADMRDLKFIRDGVFDYVICMYSTLGMIRGKKGRRAALGEMARVLKPGGRMFLHIYNRFLGEVGWFFDFRWLTDLLKINLFGLESGDLILREFRGIKNFYLHMFTTSEIKRLLRVFRLRPMEVFYINAKENGKYKAPIPWLFARAMLIAAVKV
jgi:SAM-dependent methyltransferase